MKSTTLVVLAIGAIVSTFMAIPTAGQLYPGNSEPVAATKSCTLLGLPTFKSNTFDIYKDCVNVGNGELNTFEQKSKLLAGPFIYNIIKSPAELVTVVNITESAKNKGQFLVFLYVAENEKNKSLLDRLANLLVGTDGGAVTGVLANLVILIINLLSNLLGTL